MNWIKNHLGKWYVAALWTLILLVLMCLPGNVLPTEPPFQIANFDKLVHIGLFGGFVFLWCLYATTLKGGLKKRLLRFSYYFIIGIALGIAMEFVQKYFIPLRSFDLGDIIADMIGASLAYAFANVAMAVEIDAH